MAPPRSHRVCLVVFLAITGFHSALSLNGYKCYQAHPISLLEGYTNKIIVPSGQCGTYVPLNQLQHSPEINVQHLDSNATYAVFLLKDDKKNGFYDIKWQLGHVKPFGESLTHNKTRLPLIMYMPPMNASANYTVLVYKEYNSTADVYAPNHSLFNPHYWASVVSAELTTNTTFQIVPSPTPTQASPTMLPAGATTRPTIHHHLNNTTTPKTGKSSAVQLLSSFPAVALAFAYLTKTLMF